MHLDCKLKKLARLALACVLCVGCAGYSARTRDARDALNEGNPELALRSINKQLRVESAQELPDNIRGDQALLLLDRAAVLQQLGDHKFSARDLEVADKQIEMMDFSRSTLDEIGRYAFSDNTGPYKAPPYEKLMLNTLNMLNYLVQGKLSGARVEARRFAIMQKYLKDNAAAGADLLGPGSYFAGFIFEKSNDPETALLYYEEALRATPFRSLEEPVVRLGSGMRRPPEHIKKLLDKAAAAGETRSSGASPQSEAAGADEAELLIVINYGRVPAKEAMRLPIGLAITAAGQSLPPEQRTLAVERASLKGAVTWVNFPTLPEPRPIAMAARATVDSVDVPVDVVSVDDLVVEAWNHAKGGVIASAITRAITRAVTGEVVEAAGGREFGLLLNLATQATMTVADTPDTRSWATLPARMTITRLRLTPGNHTVELSVGNHRQKYSVELPPGGWKALALTMLSR
jgi:uncharacterized protein